MPGSTRAFFAVRAYTIERGRAFTEAEERSGQLVCVLGATPRRELFGARDPIDATIRIGRLPCRVIGVLAAKGGSSLGGDQDDLVLMPLTAVQRRLSGSTDVDMIYVSATDERRMTRAKAQIQRLLRERRAVPPNVESDFAVHDMKELMRTLSTVTNVLLALLAAVAAVSLVGWAGSAS